jgi:AcrR family transcriptional regulator
MPTERPKRRTRRSDGELSRTRILDAATEIAAERGYDGTSMGAVSVKCGLPASSIYWHFKDKDDLLAAVIERSFGNWLAAWQVPGGGDVQQRMVAIAMQAAKALSDSPDFLRLGLMLALEHRPVEPRARVIFMQVREQAVEQLRRKLRELVPELSDANVHQLAGYAIAGADGLFIAKEIGGDSVDLLAMFALHGQALHAMASQMIAEKT